MDDIHLDDPRKFSAKQIKIEIENASKKRNIWQYLADLLVKTLICATLVAIDFTLFANAGNYNIFVSNTDFTPEVGHIYIAIFLCSFVIMLIASFWPKLENMVLSLCFALMTIALINQFATFEKHSGLLIIFNGIFSDGINAVLYEYAFLIIGVIAFVVFWIGISALKRSFRFYFLCGLLAVWGWILSEAYFNTSSQYFRTVASSPTLRGDDNGKLLIVLSFNNLTSVDNLLSLSNEKTQNVEIKKSANNLLGFFDINNFVLYPNATVNNPYEPFLNLVSLYNPGNETEASSHVMSSAERQDYFDFSAIQKDRLYIKDSSLYKMLQKEDYRINVYQTRDIDTCYLDNKLAAAVCREKVNMPIAFNEDIFTSVDKTVLLTAQWLNSIGLMQSINSVLKAAEYIIPGNSLKPLGFDIDKLYVLNSFKVFDLIVESIDKQSGNQAYFAIIDLPSDMYAYDEFCQLKKVDEWKSEESVAFAKSSLESRREAYADQVNCLVGSLERFMQQLDKMGQLDNATIVIDGLNNPQSLLKDEDDYFRRQQSKSQVMFAIKPENAQKPEIDYSVCRVDDIVNSYLITHKPCEEFVGIRTTEKNMKQIRDFIEKNKYKDDVVEVASQNFEEWVSAWMAHNQYENYAQKKKFESSEEQNVDDNQIVELKENAVSEKVVEDVPEQKLPSISVAAQEMDVAENDEQNDEVLGLEQDAVNENNSNQDVFENSETKEENTVEVTKPEMEKTEDITATENPLTDNTEPDVDVADNNVLPGINNTEQTTTDAKSDIDTLGKDKETMTEEVVEDAVVSEDVIPDTVFDVNEDSNTTEAAIEKAKQALKVKKEKKKLSEREIPKKKLDTLVKDIDILTKNEDFRQVLEAPVAEGQNLSPEELKKQYHQNIKEAADKIENNVNLEVKVIEN